MHSLPDDALDRFRQWLSDAERDELNDPTAMSLATVSDEGRPSVRMVLLKGVDAQGFVFYTNLESRKGLDLAANRHAALCFHWKSLRRQVRVEGAVTQVSDADADQYFASRPRQSQIGAWASHQSRAMSGRVELEQAVAVQTARFGVGPIPRPTHWSGFCLAADRIEFWQDKPFRLHDRQVYTRVESVWMTETLYP